ncbi:acyl-CoA thioesterase/bile acid-CoA:amino acid N-acyltransferase family protein [Kitasatospora sp. NPDC088134]|uniref:acyl-CoA thioesterase/bile acid-CoA:amino acid N-acyltransferase family protein n=1 Tax=Kitasatospora sp. NPDC088134 TaxID=3364071 RepID=UPI0037F58464
MVWTTRRSTVLLGLAALLLTGCTSGGGPHPALAVDGADELADRPVHLRVTGLPSGGRVTLTADAADLRGRGWQSTATFRADGHGTVDVDRTAPESGGSYPQADGMGLFWSMLPTNSGGATLYVPPRPASAASWNGTVGPADAAGSASPAGSTGAAGTAGPDGFPVRITATVDGRIVAERTVTRRWTADGVTATRLTPGADRLAGTLYLPSAGTPAGRPVLLVGGSEGGDNPTTAAVLASHGHPALSLGYFGLPGLPATLRDIPVEYAADAARLLAARTGTTATGIDVIGYSRGSELALLLAEQQPDLVRRVVVYSPSDRVNGGLPDGAAWTEHGAPVPAGPIALDRIPAAVLAVAGEADTLWPSPAWARRIGEPVANGAQRQALLYPGAGHAVGILPYLPAGATDPHPGGEVLHLGGMPAGNEAARLDGWPKVLAFLDA